MKGLNIAFFAPLKRLITRESTVSRNHIIVDLVLGLAKKGHKITIFGTADSVLPGVEFVGITPRGLNFLDLGENPFYTEAAYITHAIMNLVKRQKDFDLVHNHMYPEFLPLLAQGYLKVPLITTIHAQITPQLKMAFSDFEDTNLVCISKSAKTALGIQATVIYNGIDTNFFVPPSVHDRSYFLFVGRMSKAKDKSGRFIDPKGVQNAIVVAEKSGVELKIVGNVEDKRFYDELVAPHLSSKIQFVGEVSAEQKLTREEVVVLYQGARALLFPINWEEPFGLVMTEAMACGTPVIAYERGSVPEIVIDSVTGYVVDSGSGINGLASAIKKLKSLSEEQYQEMGENARKRAEKNFSVEKMVENYERVYKEVMEKGV